MSISIRYGKFLKVAKCLSQLGMEKRKNRKMPISIMYEKIAICLSQLGLEKRKNRKMSISIRYEKT